MAAVKKIRPRKPLGDEVYEAIKDGILRGHLKPGERLIEEQLATSLGASRTPVRQAIYMLEREDLVERGDRGGFRVKPLSFQDIEEIFDLRYILEAFAARKAAETISSQSLDLLRQHNDRFGQALKKGDTHLLPDLNTSFHDALYQLSPNRRLMRSISDLRDHLYRYRVALLSMGNMPQESYADHCDMIEAMVERDPDRVEQLVRVHIKKGKEVIMAEIWAGRFELGG